MWNHHKGLWKILLAVLGLCLFSAVSAEYYGANLCHSVRYRCITVLPGQTWRQLFPDKATRETVMRLNRTNTALLGRSWLLVPKQALDFNHMQNAPFAAHIKAKGKKQVIIDLSEQAFAAYNSQGRLIYWGPASGGQAWCKDLKRPCRTVVGRFRIYRKQGIACTSSLYPLATKGGNPMPHCMHFKGAYALHGSTLPGYHSSHGCIRLFYDDAKWLNQHFASVGTLLTVKR